MPKEIEIPFEDFVKEFYKPKVYRVFHGTSNVFDKFDYGFIGAGHGSWHGYGFYFSDSKKEAKMYGDIIVEANITLKNAIDITDTIDSSVAHSGLLRLLGTIEGISKLRYQKYVVKDIIDILDKIELEYSDKKISFSDGNRDWFQHIYYEDNSENEYVIYNVAKSEILDKDYVRRLVLEKILSDKYQIVSLPSKIKDLCSAFEFTKICIEEGYDGVIAPNSNFFKGNEYVVFDSKNIQIIKP